MFGFLAVAALGPLLWLAKSALSTAQDILRDPFGWWPSGIQWDNMVVAWTKLRIGDYFLNTVWVLLGSWGFSLLVALTGGYVIAILRPVYARVLSTAVLATLFIPGVVSLISLYLVVLDLPILGLNLVDTFWAVWLPGAANAFNVLIITQFFRSLPTEIFEAAEIDGAGPFRIFWSIVLPMSKPIIGVVSVLSVVGAWKDFLWPLLVLPSPANQPLSVGLYKLSGTAELSLLMAGMFISVVVPLMVFLVFNRQVLASAGSAGAIKG